ncbi:hypothetical protein BD311DRAFT_133081 [Dichomitus squalens]|uniref:Uncharacterized protein n=1 Tax=Dichomitus squalens TaxID=114155 RepID=A0A4Q9MY45_9APHY|nr:hypothetical protein BD311DRAFT_133081 [Dichomitus squalens]
MTYVQYYCQDGLPLRTRAAETSTYVICVSGDMRVQPGLLCARGLKADIDVGYALIDTRHALLDSFILYGSELEVETRDRLSSSGSPTGPYLCTLYGSKIRNLVVYTYTYRFEIFYVKIKTFR